MAKIRKKKLKNKRLVSFIYHCTAAAYGTGRNLSRTSSCSKKTNVFSIKQKPKWFMGDPKKPIREDKIKENKRQEKEREGKESAPFEEGAYTPSSLLKMFDFISPSLSPSFGRLRYSLVSRIYEYGQQVIP